MSIHIGGLGGTEAAHFGTSGAEFFLGVAMDQNLMVNGGIGAGSLEVSGGPFTVGNDGSVFIGGNTTMAGSLQINGNLNVGGTKNFQIDDPLDPANRYLYHSAVVAVICCPTALTETTGVP